MTALEVKDYLIYRYENAGLPERDIEIMVKLIADVYLNRAFPFSSIKSQDEVDYSWVLRACISLIERGEIDLTQYTENALSNSIGASLMSEITPSASVPKSRETDSISATSEEE